MSHAPRPNVLVFLTDQQRWDCSGLHGNPLSLMPNFDRLAKAGTHLRYSFTSQPLCMPARSSLQTGRYPTQIGTHTNRCALPVGTRTLAHHFKAAGYRTAYFGKWHLAPDSQLGAVITEYQGGYQDWLAANVLELVSDAFDCRLYDGNGDEHRLPGYRVDALTNAAIDYLNAPRTQPFFFFLSYLEPHQQNSRDDYPAPNGYAERFTGKWLPPDLAALRGNTEKQIGGYYGMVKRLDESLGKIEAALRASGAWENTVLMFTSDHGCHFHTRNAEYKRSCHESSIRVPTLLHGPGFMGGGDRTELVSLIDLPPTLLDAAGIAVPTEMEGSSFVSRMRDDASPWRDEIFIQISESQNARALRTRRWKYAVAAPAADAEVARLQAFWPTYVEESLYDLENDPSELKNLIGDPQFGAVTATLRMRLLSRMAEADEPACVIRTAVSSLLPT